MFGYIRPIQDELKVKELNLYKAVYCGLCRSLSKEYGIAARFTLSYDFTFAAMLYASLSEVEPEISLKSCPFNPLKRRPHLKSNDAIIYSCDCAMLLLWGKNIDNIEDSGSLKSKAWKMLLPMSAHMANKAGARADNILKAVQDLTEEQRNIESESENVSLDALCDPTARMLAKIFEGMSEDISEKKILSRLGYMLGRYCYLCDAVDDLEKDKAKDRFNPFKDNFDAKRVNDVLTMTITQACAAYALLDTKWFKEILDNIIYLGLDDKAESLINRRVEHEKSI